MHRLGFRVNTSQIAHTAPAIFLCIAVQQLPPVSSGRDSHPIALAGYGGEVADDQDFVARRFAFSEQRARASSALS